MRSRGMRSCEIRCVSRERDDILAKYYAIFTLELHRQNPIYSRTDAFTLSGFTTASCKAALNDRNSTGHRVAYIIMTGLMHSQRWRRRNDSHSFDLIGQFNYFDFDKHC